jgi:uncharacterized membrane protein (DUF106 family)
LDIITILPFSTLFILLIAAGISLLTSLANRLLTDPKKSKEWRKEIAEWNSQLRKAQRSGDKKTVEKLMKRQQSVMKLQSKMMWQSMKVTLLFIVPLLLMWRVLGGFYIDSNNNPIYIAYFPGVGPVLPLPIIGPMQSLYWWYLLCSFFFGTVASHLFGLQSVE